MPTTPPASSPPAGAPHDAAAAASAATAPPAPNPDPSDPHHLWEEPSDGEEGAKRAGREFQGHQLGEIARSMGLVQHLDHRLMGALATLVVPLLPQCTPKALSDLAWGYAQLSVSGSRLCWPP